MTITQGSALPDVTLIQMGANGPDPVLLSEKTKGRKIVIFAVVGAFTATCHSAHVPSFIRTKDQFNAKGVEEIICVSVNDPFIMKAWGEATGATEAGITMLSDAESKFTTAIGMDFTASSAGLIARSKRYAMIVENGVVTLLVAIWLPLVIANKPISSRLNPGCVIAFPARTSPFSVFPEITRTSLSKLKGEFKSSRYPKLTPGGVT